MLRPGLVRGGLLTFAWLILFIVFVYLFIPSSRINAAIDRTLSVQGLRLAPAAHKTIMPGLAWDNALFSSQQGTLLHFKHLSVKPELLQLLAGRVVLVSTASLQAGHIHLENRITGRQSVLVKADKVALSEMPLFKTILGASVGGNLWSEGLVTHGPKGWSGELKLEIRQLEFSGIRISAFPLPDAANLNSQGMVRITDGQARLESLTLQGEGLYMRLSGNLPLGVNADATALDLVLEIMPKPEFLEKQKLVFLLLARFAVSPGVYRVPIKGTLLKPEIL